MCDRKRGDSSVALDEAVKQSRAYWKAKPTANDRDRLFQIIGFLEDLNRSMKQKDGGLWFAGSCFVGDDDKGHIFLPFVVPRKRMRGAGICDSDESENKRRYEFLETIENLLSTSVISVRDKALTSRLLIDVFDYLKDPKIYTSNDDDSLFELLSCMFNLMARCCECISNNESLDSLVNLFRANLLIQCSASKKDWPYNRTVRHYFYRGLQPDLWELFCLICDIPTISKAMGRCISNRNRLNEFANKLNDDIEIKDNIWEITCINIATLSAEEAKGQLSIERYNSEQWVPLKLRGNAGDCSCCVSLLYSSVVNNGIRDPRHFIRNIRNEIACADILRLPSIPIRIGISFTDNTYSARVNKFKRSNSWRDPLDYVVSSIYLLSKDFSSRLDITLRKDMLRLGALVRLFGSNLSEEQTRELQYLLSDEVINKEHSFLDDGDTTYPYGEHGMYYPSNPLEGSAFLTALANCTLADVTWGYTDKNLYKHLKIAANYFQKSLMFLLSAIDDSDNNNDALFRIGTLDRLRIGLAVERIKLARIQCLAALELYSDGTVSQDTALELIGICQNIRKCEAEISPYVEDDAENSDNLVDAVYSIFENVNRLNESDRAAVSTPAVSIALICRLIQAELKVDLCDHMNDQKRRILEDLVSMDSQWWSNAPKAIAEVCDCIIHDAKELLREDYGRLNNFDDNQLLYYSSIKNACHLFDEMTDDNEVGHLTVVEKVSDSPDSPSDENNINCLTVMNAKYMNDPNEGRALLGCLFSGGTLFGETEEMFREEVLSGGLDFIRSFTTLYDTLNMWSLYGSSAEGEKSCDGCCVEIDPLTFSEAIRAYSIRSVDSPCRFGVEDIDIRFPWQSVKEDATLFSIYYLERSDNGYDFKNSSEVLGGWHKQKSTRIASLLEVLRNQLRALSAITVKECKIEEMQKIRRFIASQVSPILYLFKDAGYYQEEEKRLVIFRDTDEQSLKTIRVLPASEPNAPRRLCINPRYQVYVKSITLGPNVDQADEWVPDLMYRLGKMKAKALKNGIRDYDPKVYFSKIPFR